jgi:hypothetical protein
MTRVAGNSRRVLAEHDPLVMEAEGDKAGLCEELVLRNIESEPLTVFAVSLRSLSGGHEVTFSRHARVGGRGTLPLAAHDLGNLARIVLQSSGDGQDVTKVLAAGAPFTLTVRYRTTVGPGELVMPLRISRPKGAEWFFEVAG